MEKSSNFDFKLEDDEEVEMPEVYTDEEDDFMGVDKVNISRIFYKPTEEEIQKLKAIDIEMQHCVPPQHNVEATAGTRTLTKDEKKKFEEYVTLKQGKFTKIEDKMLVKNWKLFCKLHNWDDNNPKPFLHMKYKNEQFFLSRKINRMRFVQFLAKGLNDRSLYSVYQRFRVLFEPHKVKRYKPEEDNIIISFMNKQFNANEMDTFRTIRNRKFADLALILKRTRASVWRRYRILQKKLNNM